MEEQKRSVLFYITIALIVLSISIAIVPGFTEADEQRLFKKTTGIIMVSDLKFYALDPETGKVTRLTPSLKGITNMQYQAETKNLIIGVKNGAWYACKADGSNLTSLNVKPTKSRWSLLPSPDLTKVMFDEVTYKTDAPGYERADKTKVIIKDIR